MVLRMICFSHHIFTGCSQMHFCFQIFLPDAAAVGRRRYRHAAANIDARLRTYATRYGGARFSPAFSAAFHASRRRHAGDFRRAEYAAVPPPRRPSACRQPPAARLEAETPYLPPPAENSRAASAADCRVLYAAAFSSRFSRMSAWQPPYASFASFQEKVFFPPDAFFFH